LGLPGNSDVRRKHSLGGAKISGDGSIDIGNVDGSINAGGDVIGGNNNTTNIYVSTPDLQEQKLAQDRDEETLLQNYRDKMDELLLPPHNLRSSPEDSPVRNIARGRTLTVLKDLNADRKGAVVRYLYESKLIEAGNLIINWAGANLQGADLKRANLAGADLTDTNLHRANLARTLLAGANLARTLLAEANLQEANLKKVNLKAAILSLSPNPKGFRLKLQLKALCKGKSTIDNPTLGNP
jgi:hypothetical protein